METTTDGRFGKRFLKGSCTLVYQVSGVGYGRWKYDDPHNRRPREGRDWGLLEIPAVQVDKDFWACNLIIFKESWGCVTRAYPWHRHRLPSEWSGVPVSIWLLHLHRLLEGWNFITANIKPSLSAGTPAMHSTPSQFFVRGCPTLNKDFCISPDQRKIV